MKCGEPTSPKTITCPVSECSCPELESLSAEPFSFARTRGRFISEVLGAIVDDTLCAGFTGAGTGDSFEVDDSELI